MKLFHQLKFWMEDNLYVYITWLLELFTLRKEIMLTKTAQSLWALTKTGQSLWGLTSSINCFRQYLSKNVGLRYGRSHCRVKRVIWSVSWSINCSVCLSEFGSACHGPSSGLGCLILIDRLVVQLVRNSCPVS